MTMIALKMIDGREVRVEAARVYLPGCDDIQTYAAPLWNSKLEEPDENRWRIVEETSGMALDDDLGNATGSSVDDAVHKASRLMTHYGMTPDELRIFFIQNKRK